MAEQRPIFEESAQERREREEFYKGGGGDAEGPRSHVMRFLEVGTSGAMQLERKLEPGDVVTVTIHDADGQVLASQEAGVSGVGHKHQEKDGVLFVTRGHKVKLG